MDAPVPPRTAGRDQAPMAAAAGAPLRSGISVVVPALNEAANLAAAVARCQAAARRHFPDHAVIVVADGSTDATGRRADRLGTSHSDPTPSRIKPRPS